MRYVTGTTGQFLYFVALSTADHVTRVNDLTAFTAVWSRNGTTGDTVTGAAFSNANSTSMAGVYKMSLTDSTMMAIGAGNDSVEVCIHITSSMDPVTRTFELYRRDVTTGTSLVVDSSGAVNADVKEFGGTTVTGRDIGASVLLSSGTGVGQVVLTSGNPTVLLSSGTGVGQIVLTNGTPTVLLSSGTGTGQIVLTGGAVTASSVTGLTASDVSDIKTQTDKLAFSVTNQVDANIYSVNDTAVNGVGSTSNPWGP